ncbi:MAG: replicative DNA helicase [Armatimonadia bacterium]
MENLEKLPPQSLEMEQNLLGAMLIDHEAAGVATQILVPSDFYKGAHRTIFEVARELYDERQSLDQSLLRQTLADRGLLEEVGGIPYLTDLAASVATSAHVEQYAKHIKDRSVARQIIAAATETVRESFEPGQNSADLLENAERRIMEIGQGTFGEVHRIGDVFRPVLTKLGEQRGHGMIMGLPTGLRDLDAITGGFHPGEFNIVAGRPSTGKTSLALSIMHHLACDLQVPVGFFSLEMAREQVSKNLGCLIARVNSWKLRSDKLSNEEWGRLQTEAAAALAEAPIFIDDSPESRIVQIRAKARRMRSHHDVQLIVVDYLQLINGRSDSRQSRQEEVSAVSRGLKALARELGIPVLALCQLNRQMEDRNDHRPQPSDLRESGSLEQDADQIVLIYRPGLYENPPDRTKPITLIVGKNRNGPVADVQATFLESYFRYEDFLPPGVAAQAPVPQEPPCASEGGDSEEEG